jgi:hypothetical protein
VGICVGDNATFAERVARKSLATRRAVQCPSARVEPGLSRDAVDRQDSENM